ncbi:hypothetical protein GCM10007049_22820 [Echinicola pacifica]|uniref:SGNH hydrolase-type esterase domain-containing protein n=1 Tax=Echinicola pacifica TaxID=346377 RepID=A0A918Q134_9BACT|nr:SGNH/GDSL hydrolase family protein [Echinicola pacifica]GGZ29122.1 hypothetical protein GCM10007049_22820 [Echinicola pacifica]
MKRFILFVIFSFGAYLPLFSQHYKIPEGVERIVFLGNSISYQGTYIEYIETFLRLKYPEREFTFINVGLPSETVSGLSEPNHAGGDFPRPDLHERLNRVLALTQPDMVFSCYGMNDGIYLPFDTERFNKYQEGIDWLDEQVKASGANIVHITPPIYDERKGAAYANVLDIYSDWLLSKRYTDQWEVIDLHWPMRKSLEDQRLEDSTFAFAKDGVHPDAAGHFLMAREILLSLGESDLQGRKDWQEVIDSFENGEQLFMLVEQQQKMMKDAWLSYIGHLRPRMNTGLPMEEAMKNYEQFKLEVGKIQ